MQKLSMILLLSLWWPSLHGMDSDEWSVENPTAYNVKRAIEKDDAELIEKMIHSNKKLLTMPATETDPLPLIYAIMNKKTEIAELLIALGADINSVDTYAGLTPLLAAILYEEQKIANLLLDKQVDVTLKTTKFSVRYDKNNLIQHFYPETTPLLAAAWMGNEDIVKNILKSPMLIHGNALNIYIDTADQEGNTPLKVAREFKYRGIIQLLEKNNIIDQLNSFSNQLHILAQTLK